MPARFSFRITRFWAAALTAFVLALVAAASAQAAGPVDMKAVHNSMSMHGEMRSPGHKASHARISPALTNAITLERPDHLQTSDVAE